MSDIHSDEKGKVLDHNYDDINELDNPLPGWWLVTFWGTVIFAAIYYVYYTFAGGPTTDQELKAAMDEVKQSVQAAQATAPQGGPDWTSLMKDPNAIAAGKVVYDGKCMACHGDKGQGMIGPNMTDDHWIHVDGTLDSFVAVVKKGVVEKGMPPWDGQLTPAEINNVTVYVRSLAGSNPANAKAPQGEVKPWAM